MTKDPDSLDPARISPRYKGSVPGDVARALARGQKAPKREKPGAKEETLPQSEETC